MRSNRITPMELQFVDVSTIIAGAYASLSAIEGALSFVRVTNDSNTNVFISFDGIEDHIYVKAGDSVPYPYQNSSAPMNNVSKLPKNTIPRVRGTAGVGYVYISGWYNE